MSTIKNQKLHDQLAYGIGSLIMEWATCESIIYGLLEALAGRDQTANGALLWLSIRGARDRRELVMRLARVQDLGAVTSDEIDAICRRFKTLTNARNHYCHSMYHSDLDGNVVSISSYGLIDQPFPVAEEKRDVSKAMLNEIACAINEGRKLNVDTWRLLIRLREALKVQKPTLPPQLDAYLNKVDPPSRP